MFSKYLIGFVGVGAVASGAAVTAISWRSLDSNKEKENNLKNHQENASLKSKEAREKLGFSGTLLFSKDNKNPLVPTKLGNVFYQAELLDNKNYEKRKIELEEKNKDDNDPEFFITIEISSEKTEEEIKNYLKNLNKKLETQPKSSESGLPLNKLEKLLKDEKENFEKIFDSSNYEKLLEAIKKLQKNEEIK